MTVRQKGERWLLQDGREVIITWDLARGFVRVLKIDGTLEVIHDRLLKKWLNESDFSSVKKA